MISGESSI